MTRRDRTVLNTLLLILLVAGSFRPFLVRLVLPPHRMADVAGPEGGLDRKPLRLWDDSTPLELRQFLAMLPLVIDRGHTVALDFAPPFDGWSYVYWRANYELAGRYVRIPNVMDAEYVVSWHSQFSDPAFVPIWSGFGGTVLKRR